MTTNSPAAQSGQLTISRIILFNSDSSKKESLLGLFTSVDISESIYSNSLAIAVDIADAVDLLGTFPILGEEQIEIEFVSVTDPEEDPITLTFDITSVQGLERDTKGVIMGYTLVGFSKETILNELISIDAKFNSNIADGVENALGYLGQELVSKSRTEGVQEITVPGLSPFSTISLLLKYAYSSKNPFQQFLFYKNLEGFHFESLFDMTEKEPVAAYAYDINVAANQNFDLNEKVLQMKTFSIVDRANSLKYINESVFSRVARVADYHRKRIIDVNTNYEGQLSKLKKLSKKAAYTPGIHTKDFVNANEINPSTYVIYQNHVDRRLGYQIGDKMASISFFGQLSAKFTARGNYMITVGKVIELVSPRVSSDGKERINDEQISGEYLVTDVTHSFTTQQYQISCNIARHGYTKEFYHE